MGKSDIRVATTQAVLALVALAALPSRAHAQCTGDCDGNGSVVINELITGVNIALGNQDTCAAFDLNGNRMVAINELIVGVNNALGSCPATPTPPADTETPTPVDTETATPVETETPTPPATSTATAADTETATPAATATDTTVATPTATDTAPPAATATATPTASLTATAAETPTFTPTASPTMGSGSVCGNGFLEAGETCVTCAADCQVQPCTATTPTVAFAVDLVAPLGFAPTTTTVLVGYQSSRMSIPGSGTATSVRQRVVAPAPIPQSFAPNDLDYAVRVLVSRNTPVGQIATITFDRCTGQPAPTLADLACQVETCSQGGSPVPGCTCTVRVP